MGIGRTPLGMPMGALLIIGAAVGFASAHGAFEGADPRQLVQEMVNNELRSQNRQSQDNRLWSYRKLTRKGGKEYLWGFCETKQGTVHRLLAVNGKPLTDAQQHAEDRRIQELIASSAALRKAQQEGRRDGNEERKFMKLLPEIFRYQAEERNGNLQTLSFTPDTAFHPSGNEERVVHAMQGKLVIDLEQKRLVRIHGRLVSEVKFWGGLAGYLNQGGTCFVETTCLAPDDRELKTLDIAMQGKALFFKTISVHEHDVFSQYAEVPSDITLPEAADRLKKDAGS